MTDSRTLKPNSEARLCKVNVLNLPLIACYTICGRRYRVQTIRTRETNDVDDGNDQEVQVSGAIGKGERERERENERDGVERAA